jgi:FkbM family methyltransferase
MFEVNFYGLKYCGNLNSFLDWHVYFFGAYEKESLPLYRHIASFTPSPIFLDVGANVGQHSIFMSQYCSLVHSFEPNPDVRCELEEKIGVNKLKNVVIHDVGLGEKDGNLTFYAPQGCNKGTGSFVKGFSMDNKEQGCLKVVNGDDYLSDLNLTNIALIKIDVEGFEKAVLMGLKNTIEVYRPSIIIEFTAATKDSFSDSLELFSLFPDTYKIKKIVCNRPKFLFFNSPEWILEDFNFDIPGGDLLISQSIDSF